SAEPHQKRFEALCCALCPCGTSSPRNGVPARRYTHPQLRRTSAWRRNPSSLLCPAESPAVDPYIFVTPLASFASAAAHDSAHNLWYRPSSTIASYPYHACRSFTLASLDSSNGTICIESVSMAGSIASFPFLHLSCCPRFSSSLF